MWRALYIYEDVNLEMVGERRQDFWSDRRVFLFGPMFFQHFHPRNRIPHSAAATFPEGGVQLVRDGYHQLRRRTERLSTVARRLQYLSQSAISSTAQCSEKPWTDNSKSRQIRSKGTNHLRRYRAKPCVLSSTTKVLFLSSLTEY